MKYTSIGGQAVMEGVMMRSSNSMAMSVRRSDGSIVTEKKIIVRKPWRKTVAKIPVVRGVVAFVESLVQGMGLTTRSAEMYGEDALADEEPTKFEKWISEKFNIKLETVVMAVGVVLGLALSFFLFIFLPSLASKGFWALLLNKGITPENASLGTKLLLDIIEGVIKILIFIGYIVSISFMKDIKRLFMYHGAEHKVISCYEHGLPLTPENAQKFSTSHPRCGTSFLFIIMTVGILLTAVADDLFGLSTATAGAMVVRLAVKLAMLPLIAGVSYELLKLLALSDNIFFRILRAPGMLMQKLTTRQPDDSMLEVSIKSFKTVLYTDGLSDENPEEAENITSVNGGNAENTDNNKNTEEAQTESSADSDTTESANTENISFNRETENGTLTEDGTEVSDKDGEQ